MQCVITPVLYQVLKFHDFSTRCGCYNSCSIISACPRPHSFCLHWGISLSYSPTPQFANLRCWDSIGGLYSLTYRHCVTKVVFPLILIPLPVVPYQAVQWSYHHTTSVGWSKICLFWQFFHNPKFGTNEKCKISAISIYGSYISQEHKEKLGLGLM